MPRSDASLYMLDLLNQLDALLVDPDEKSKGDMLGRITKWILQTTPIFKTQLEKVWLWEDYPHAWEDGSGIDLVALPVAGKLWAIKTKAYQEGDSVSQRDVSDFVDANSSSKEIGHLLLVTTAGSISQSARHQFESCGKSYTIFTRDKLLELDLPNIPRNDLRPRRVDKFEPKNLREHQRDAVNATIKGFKDYDRGQLIHASGTGKTLTAIKIHERLKCDHTLVFVPSVNLLKQTLRDWTRHAERSFIALAVCSDTEDRISPSVTNIGLPVLTDVKTIRAALKKHKKIVVFATYQSSRIIEEAQKWTRHRFKLMIADEAHRAIELGGSDFTKPPSEQLIRADKRLFMTAIPRIYGLRTKTKLNDEDIVVSSMDDRDQYGPRFHTFSFSEAIEQNLLMDYRVVIVGIEDKEVAKLARQKRFRVSRDGKTIHTSELGAHIAVAKTMRRFNTRRIITFHSLKNKAKQFADIFPAITKWMGSNRGPGGTVWAESIESDMPGRERKQTLKRLAEPKDREYGLISNAQCFENGIGIPSLDGIAFVGYRESQIEAVQVVGRAIRQAESSKGTYTIILPVLIKTDESVKKNISSPEFKNVWKLILALRAHDDTLSKELDGLRRRYGSKGRKAKLPSKIILDFPSKTKREFNKALSDMLIKYCAASWESWFEALEDYVLKQGHAWVPTTYKNSNGLKLGVWCVNQRNKYLNGKLFIDYTERLEALPGWNWDPKADRFEEYFDDLKDYVSKHGHALVPQRYESPNGLNLGAWCHTRRVDYSNDKLPSEYIEQLETLEGWSWNPLADQFEKNFSALEDYVAKHGHAWVPHRHKMPGGLKLGAWCNAQRVNYYKGKLPTEYAKRLKALQGWNWDPLGDHFDRNIGALEEYASEHGGAHMPQRYKTLDGINLGTWCNAQRNKYRKGELAAEYAERLEALPGWHWKSTKK